MTIRTTLALGLLLGATACPGDPAGTTDGASTGPADTDGASATGAPTTGGSTDTPTGGPDAGQTCGCDPALDDCGDVICDPVFALCSGDCADLSLGTEDQDSLKCVLAALRDRTPGTVSLIRDGYDPLLSFAVVVRIFPDGSAWLFRREAAECMPMGFSATGPDAVVTLKEPAEFAACLADADPGAGFRCAQDPAGAVLAECAPRVDLCG